LIEKDIAELVVEYTKKIHDLMEEKNCKDLSVVLAAFAAPLSNFLRDIPKEQRIWSVRTASRAIIREAPEEDRLAISGELFVTLSAETAVKSPNAIIAFLASFAALIDTAFRSAPKEVREKAIDGIFEMIKTART